MIKNRNRFLKFSDIFPVALFALCWAWLIGLTYYTAGNILDADASNVLVLSNFLTQENSIMSIGWRYYTELHVINMQLVYSFFFRLFDRWQMVRFLGTVTLQAIFVMSYWFFCRQIHVSRNAFFYSATVLLLPTSVTYARIVLLHGHYTFHISLAFLILGLLVNLSTKLPLKKTIHYLKLAIYLVLCFLSGTNGMRQLYISLAPALLVAFYWFMKSAAFRNIMQRTKAEQPHVFHALFATAKEPGEARGFLFAVCGAIANFFGIAVNLFVLRRLFGFSTYYSLQTIAPKAGALNLQINDLLNLFGYRDGAKVFSFEGVPSLLAVVALFAMIGFSVWYFASKNQNDSFPKRFGATLFFGALLLESLVFLITANYYIHYYTPVFVLIAILLATMYDEFPLRSIRLPRAVACLLLIAFLFSGLVTTNYLVNQPENYATKYEGLAYSNINQVKQIKPAAQYLAEHGFTFGYAYYWDSSIVTELTDGKVEVCAIVEPPDITYSFANTKKAFWDVNYHQGKTFLLLESNDTSWTEYPILAGGTEIYSDDFYKIIEYPNPIPFERSPFSD